jgi:hypothetical protein
MNMRKAILLTAAAAFLAIPALVEAQSATVDVRAYVLAGLDVVEPEGLTLDFGDVAAGDEPRIDHENGEMVRIDVNGSPDRSISVQYDPSIQLTGPDGAALTFTPFVFEDEEGNSLTTGGSVSTGTSGTASIWLGGNLGTIGDNQAPGQYSGDFEITFDYDG